LRVSLELRGISSDVMDTVSSVGAGAFPDAELPSVALSLHGDAGRWARALRESDVVAVVGRVHDGRLLIDLRAVLEHDLRDLERAIAAAHD